jgi:hypothetical protein
MPISAEQLAGGAAEVTFPYQGDTVTLSYRTDKITKEFRARALRMQRESKRIERRHAELEGRVYKMDAEDGSDEAAREDADAEAAIAQLVEDDATLKRQIDLLVCEVVERWDVLKRDGTMYPITPESLFPMSARFEGMCLEAIGEDASMGEPIGSNSSKPSPLLLRQKDELEIGPQSQNSTTISRQVNGALP